MSRHHEVRQDALRARIRTRIERGALPVFLPDRVSAGFGSGLKCLACGQPITRAQLEYEVEDTEDDTLLGFHSECHVLWQRECEERMLTPVSADL